MILFYRESSLETGIENFGGYALGVEPHFCGFAGNSEGGSTVKAAWLANSTRDDSHRMNWLRAVKGSCNRVRTSTEH